MISCSPELAIELFTAILLIALAVTSPSKAAASVAIVSLGGGYLQLYGFHFPLSVVHGSEVVGKNSMKAVVHHRISPHGVVIAEVPVPFHLSSQVLIRVSAASLRSSEVQGRAPFVIPWVRHIWKVGLGSGVAGQVVSVGTSLECAFIQVGDSIFGVTASSMAEYAVVPCNACAKRPQKLPIAQAAALPGMLLPIIAALDYAEIQLKRQYDRSQTQSLAQLFGNSYGGAGSMLAQTFLKLSPGEDFQGLVQKKVLMVVENDLRGSLSVAAAKAMGAEVAVATKKNDLKFFKNIKSVFDFTDELLMSKFRTGDVKFDVIIDVISRVNHSSVDPPNMRFLLSLGGVYSVIHQLATPLWVESLRPFVSFASWARGGSVNEDFHSLLRNPPGRALNRLARWIDEGKLPISLEQNTIPISTNTFLWQTFHRMKSSLNVLPLVFTFPIDAFAM